MPPSPPPSAPEIHIEIEMQPPPILLSPPSPPQPPINVQPRPQPWEGSSYSVYGAMLEMCFFLTLFIGFGAIVYLLTCTVVTLIDGSDQTYCYDFL